MQIKLDIDNPNVHLEELVCYIHDALTLFRLSLDPVVHPLAQGFDINSITIESLHYVTKDDDDEG